MKAKIRKYAPSVFHHIRKIDQISIKDCLSSLEPDKNFQIINESFAQGGRSANPIIFSHDKRFLLKTISKNEKNILLKLLPEYHRRMRDLNSYLCRIYGIFRIKLGDKADVHILLMRNMCELSANVNLFLYSYYLK